MSGYLHETAEILQVVDELEQVADVVCDGGAVGVASLQVLFVNLAHSCTQIRQKRPHM